MTSHDCHQDGCRTTPITDQELADIREIIRLHDEALVHALAEDGHHKSQEGAVEIHIPNYFERCENWQVAVGVYSYVLGPSRWHYFDSTQDALDTVREWHREEMEGYND